jgi:Tol biopolymer transport system component
MTKNISYLKPLILNLIFYQFFFASSLIAQKNKLTLGSNGVITYCYQPVSGSETKKIYRINEDGTNNIQIGNLPISVNGPKWSPDGQKIVLYGYPNSSTWSIYLMNSDGSNFQRLTSTEGVWDNAPGLSPNSTKIAFTRTYPNLNGKEEIWVMDSNGDNKFYTGILGGSAKWSPNGSKFVYHANRGNNYDIYVSNTDGTNEVRITTSAGIDFQPSWSPDGTKIAFISDRDSNYEVYTINADGTGLTRLTNNNADDFTPVWSPDGNRIAFESDLSNPLSDHGEIYVIDVNGTNLKRVTNTSVSATAINPDWNPNSSPSRVNDGKSNFSLDFKLPQNYPNPFNLSTKISFQVPEQCIVSIKIYDVLGNDIVTLVNEEKAAGDYEVNFSAINGFASGVYFCQMKAGNYIQTRKMILLK